jgi:hypothetical protein
MEEVKGKRMLESNILYEPTTSLPYCFTFEPFKHFILYF